MRANLFWLNDEQWAKIKPLIPMNRPGPKPQNNRRILSGIIHVLKTGCRWQDCPPEYGPHTTVYNRFNRWSGRGIWQQLFETVAVSLEPLEQAALDSTHVKAHRYRPDAVLPQRLAKRVAVISLRRWGKRGASEQAIGVTKGGRNSKIHAIADKFCRPWVLILTPGNTADCTVGPTCVSLVDGIKELLGDKTRGRIARRTDFPMGRTVRSGRVGGLSHDDRT